MMPFSGCGGDCGRQTDDTRIIQYLTQMAKDVYCVKERMEQLDSLEDQMRTLSNNMDHLCLLVNRASQQKQGLRLHTGHTHTRERPPERSGNKGRRPPKTARDVSDYLHLPEALQMNILNFLEKFMFKDTIIPDELLANGCLTEDECRNMRNCGNTKDEIRQLIRAIKSRGPDIILQFLDIIEKPFPFLKKDVMETYKKRKENSKRPICVICLMKTTVVLKDIVDPFWQEKIIGDDLYGDITDPVDSASNDRNLLWQNMINAINNFSDPDSAINLLAETLETKYMYIANHIKELRNTTPSPLSCCCVKRTRLRNRVACMRENTGSTSDVSTTSDIRPNFDKINPEDTSDDFQYDSIPSMVTTSLKTHSFSSEHLDKYIDKNDDVTYCDSTTNSGEHMQDINEHVRPSIDEDNNTTDLQCASGQFEIGDYRDGLMIMESEVSMRTPLVHSSSVITVCSPTSTTSDTADENMELEEAGISASADSSGSCPTKIQTVDMGKDVPFFTPEDVLDVPKEVTVDNPADTLNSVNTPDKATAAYVDKSNNTLPRRMRRHTYAARHDARHDVPLSDDEEEVETIFSRNRRTRHKSHKRKVLTRQKCLLEANTLTQSRPVVDPTTFNSASRQHVTRESKGTLKHAETYQSQGQNSHLVTSAIGAEAGEIPYNSMWTTEEPHARQIQQRRHPVADLFGNTGCLCGEAEREHELVAVGSDTDLRTEDIDDVTSNDAYYTV